MGEIEFIFQVNEYDSEHLQPQVSRALRRRMELRTQRPGMDPSKMTEAQRKQQKMKRILWGIIWLAVGIYLLASGLIKSGTFTASGIIGVIAIIWGISKLLPKRKPDLERYDKAAKEFLEGHKENIGKEEHQVCFSDEEMIVVTGAVEDLDQEAVTYGEIDFGMETEDIFLLVHGGRGVMLQKKDITLGTVDEFRDYIAAHIKSFTPYEPEETATAEVPTAVESAEPEAEPEVAEETVEAENAEEAEETVESEAE